MNFDLSRMERLMSALANPQDTFPSIHIAGTNGKGSVAAMISNSLVKSGLKTGLYTSPHLVNLQERFQINGESVSLQDISRAARHLQGVKMNKLTQFEFLTALGFIIFAEKKVQVVVIEVGLGGRLDATNVLKNVVASVITNIDLDHTQWLGNSIRKIAGEKAGIVKPGVPVVTGATGVAFQVIKRVSRKNKTKLFKITKSWVDSVSKKTGPLALAGRHQKLNAAIAFKTLKTLQSTVFPLTNSSIIQGIKSAHWPGRFEKFLWKGRTVILDGAHNPAAVRVLLQTLKDTGIKKVDLLFGVLKDKDVKTIVDLLSPVVEKGLVVPVSSSRSANPGGVSKLESWRGFMVPEKNGAKAFSKLIKDKSSRPLLVTGSLYLVGEIRKLVGKHS